jgi:SulP family sulfate permease
MRFTFIKLRDLIPRTAELFSTQGRRYGATDAVKDCVSGIIVGIVAMPLAMAFSIAAGGSPAQGLYTAIIAGFCVSAFGGSRFQIGGPTGAFVVIIFGVINRHGMAGLVAATALAGILLMVMGLCGLGRFIKFIPYPVTTGFTAGIGILIFSQQVKDFFALDIAKTSPEFFGQWTQYIGAASTFQPVTVGVGVGTMAIIILVRRIYPRIPGAVVGVVALTVLCAVLKLPVETIGTRFGGIPSTLPRPVMPEISWHVIRDVLPDAVSIALLAAIESLLSAVVADGMTGDRHNSNTELFAQGLGNLASAIFGGIPATGAIARTATNIKSGAVSPVSGMVHAVTLLLFILFLAPAASAIPLASLSAVLMVVAWDMSNLPRVVRLVRTSPASDAGVLIITLLLTIIVDLTFAVEVGVGMAVVLFLIRMVRIAEVKFENEAFITELLHHDSDTGKHHEDSIRALTGKDIDIYEITGPFFFGVADMLQNTLRQVAKAPRLLILRMADVPAIDSTGITALESFLAQCKKQKIRLIITELRAQPHQALARAGFLATLGPENIAPTVEEAIERDESTTSA